MSRVKIEFQKEIDTISSESFKSFVEYILDNSPDYLVEIPSSPTGKHHPKDELNKDGMIRHVRKCFVFMEALVEMYELSDNQRDILLAGCIIHDLYKNGETNSGKTDHNHEIIVFHKIRQFYDEIYKSDAKLATDLYLDYKMLALICLAHSGRWVPDGALPLIVDHYVVLDEEERLMTRCMHLVDCLAANRKISEVFQYEREDSREVEGSEKDSGP